MLAAKNYKFWFCNRITGSVWRGVPAHRWQSIPKSSWQSLNESGVLPYEVVWKPTLITNELIRKTFNEANADEECAGVITWMHTFSPAKSWILGLQEYRKPLLHLHTQFNEEIPYDTIDMDFMNENQSAHGDREYGHIVTTYGHRAQGQSWDTGSDRQCTGAHCILDAHRSRRDREQPYPRDACRRQHEKRSCYRGR